jgi:hypothetical protein
MKKTTATVKTRTQDVNVDANIDDDKEEDNRSDSPVDGNHVGILAPKLL